MFPVLLTIGNIPISSFGIFLAGGFLVGVFLIWRLARAWDLNEEKILDLTLLTFLGGLLGARTYFVLEHLSYFWQNPLTIVLFNKVPGFSFWGAFLGGWLTLFYLARRGKLDFWQLGDIAAIGLLGGLILSDLGCFLGGCNVGIANNSFLAVNMLGSLGKRFPVQALESVLFLIILLSLWSKATHFHQNGKILSLSLIYIGVIKFLTENLKEVKNEGIFLSLILIILGISIFYKVTARNFISDCKEFVNSTFRFFTDSIVRKKYLESWWKYWYNNKTAFWWNVRNLKKSLQKINVRFSYKNNKLH
ncbi:prolipoprotein diacylglyceryl transferase [Candidatus Daviesbacteria bacterium]|nr:prolipoprotein diacylglyceryl transferase [Candidatus Daviesbacteria bacterium]